MPSPLRLLTENWQLKTLALALAVLLWVVVSAEQVTSSWIPVPVLVEEADPEFEMVSGESPGEVEVRFTGSGRDLMELAIRKPPLVLTVDRVQSNNQEFRLEPGMVQVPNQLAVSAQEVRNPLLRLRFRRLASRTLPIRPTVDIEVASGWTLVDTLRLLPAEIEIRGPAEEVEMVQEVRTLPFTLPAADSLFSTVVRIDTTNLSGLDLSTTQVRVSGRVDRIVQRRLVDVPISLGSGVTVRPSVVDVLLSGPRSLVEAVQPESLRIAVAIESVPGYIPPEGVSVPLRAEQVPAEVRASVVPPAVRLLPAVAPPLPEDAQDGSEVLTDTLPGGPVEPGVVGL